MSKTKLNMQGPKNRPYEPTVAARVCTVILAIALAGVIGFLFAHDWMRALACFVISAIALFLVNIL